MLNVILFVAIDFVITALAVFLFTKSPRLGLMVAIVESIASYYVFQALGWLTI